MKQAPGPRYMYMNMAADIANNPGQQDPRSHGVRLDLIYRWLIEYYDTFDDKLHPFSIACFPGSYICEVIIRDKCSSNAMSNTENSLIQNDTSAL